MLIELEADASWIRTYEGGAVIPGLLQTRDYAERIITAGSPHMRAADIDRYLELRMRRQKRIHEGMRLTAILGEAAVRQQVGGPSILRAQLRHIAHVVRECDVTVQVVPFTADAHAAVGESFVIIQWPDEADPEAVYVDGVTSWTVHERAGAIRSYLYAVASVQSQALAPARFAGPPPRCDQGPAMSTASSATRALAWRKSSYSTSTGNCVEIAPMADGVAVRHSKHPDAGTISLPRDVWAMFVRETVAGAPVRADGVVTVARDGAETVVGSPATGVELRFDGDEWAAFRAGAADGEFDFPPIVPNH